MSKRYDARALQEAFRRARARSDMLFALFRPEAYYERPIPLRNPVFFYDGHLDSFNWNTLFRRLLKEPSFHPAFDDLFARGIDPASEEDVPTLSAYPSREEIHAYKAEITKRLHHFLEKADPEDPRLRGGEIFYLLLEHELMHQETLLYILRELPPEKKVRPPEMPEADTGEAPTPYMVEIPPGRTFLGAARGTLDFGWDNEFEGFFTEVPGFSIDAYPVTNGQFLEFIEAGGYQERSFWDDESWAWLTRHKKTSPHFWKKVEGRWMLRSFLEEIPLPLSWPVNVTLAEARAYARFVKKRLPTEAEWQRAAFGEGEAPYPWGEEAPSPEHGNFDFQRWGHTRVGAHPRGRSASGVYDLLGNGWEWTETPFGPFSGFLPDPDYTFYSTDFFDQKHFVLKGGGPFTEARLLRRSFRNWFFWNYPYVDATFRCVAS